MHNEARGGPAEVDGITLHEALESGTYGWLVHGREDSASRGVLPADTSFLSAVDRAGTLDKETNSPEAPGMKRNSPLCFVLMAAALAACDQTTAPTLEVLDEADVAKFAEAVAESNDVRLPSLGALLKASRAAIQAQEGNEVAVGHFRRARRLTNAAEDSLEAGNIEAAEGLARRSYRQKLAGIVAALDDDAVGAAVTGSVAGLTRIQDRLEGRDVPQRIMDAVTRIATRVAWAEEKLVAGEHAAALHQALAAADGIRHLSPRYVATKSIQRASQLLRAARQAVGEEATDEEATAIRRAARLRNLAKDEFEAGHMGKAVNIAARSASLSWGVVEGRSGS